MLTNKNEIYVWGENDHGQLGLAPLNEQEVKSSVVPKKLPLADQAIDIDAGYNYSVAVTLKEEKLSLWTWGCNDEGQLGLGDQKNR